MAPIRIAIVGAGPWGLCHARTFAADPRARVSWICDRDPAILAGAHAAVPAARATERLADVLAADDVDAVVIATPSRSHAELALAVLHAGRHLLIEKPMATTPEAAAQIVALAARAQRVVAVGHLLLHHPAFELLRKLVADGELGELRYTSSTRVNLGKLRSDENALWSLGPHDIAMLDALHGTMPVSATARGESYLQTGIADVVFGNLSYAAPDGGGGSGAARLAQLHLSWLNPRKERRLTVVGSRKMAEFDDCAPEALRIYDRGYDRPPEFADFASYLTLRNGDVFTPRIAMVEPLAAQATHFLDCIEHGVTPRSGAAAGQRVVRVLAALQASLELGGAPVALATS